MADNLNISLQKSIIKLLILEDDFISMVSGDLKTEYFSSIISRKIVKICLDYYESYKEAPKQHFNDELYDTISDLDEEDKEDYITFIESLERLNPNITYVLSRISTFIKQKEFENSAIKFAELTSEGNFDDAESLMYKTLKSGIYERDEPFDYGSDFSLLEKRGEKEKYLMSTGIKALDHLIGGYKRGELICNMGGYKGKKTWSLMFVAKTAIDQGLNVIYFTHEISVDEMDKRFDMMLTKKASESKYINTTVEASIYDEKLKEIFIQPYKAKYVFGDKERNKQIRKDWTESTGGVLKIKKYPMSSCSVEQMENYLDYMEQYHDFIPDVVITDYLEKMDITKYSNESRHQIDEGYKRLKKIADERQVAVFTASQIVTGALNKEKITMTDLAEDRRKAGNVDLLLAVSGSEEGERIGLGRITVVAARSSGSMGEHCTFSHCLPIGQFAISSWFGDNLTRDAFAAFGEE